MGPSGKAFKIHRPKEFADVVMPRYFDQTKYRSFQRQLYIYGFDRVRMQAVSNSKDSPKSNSSVLTAESDDEVGGYAHPLFIRGQAELCLDMTRKKVKGNGYSNDE